MVKPVPGKPGQWRPASDRTRWKPPRSAGSPHSAVLSLPTLPPAPMWLRITGLSFPCQLSYLGDKESGGERICAEDSGQPDNPTCHLQSPKLGGCPEKAVPTQGPSCLSLQRCASWAEQGRSRPWGWAHLSGCPTEPVGNLPKGGTLPSSPSRIW